jgi:hypothetical protein
LPEVINVILAITVKTKITEERSVSAVVVDIYLIYVLKLTFTWFTYWKKKGTDVHNQALGACYVTYLSYKFTEYILKIL